MKEKTYEGLMKHKKLFNKNETIQKINTEKEMLGKEGDKENGNHTGIQMPPLLFYLIFSS